MSTHNRSLYMKNLTLTLLLGGLMVLGGCGEPEVRPVKSLTPTQETEPTVIRVSDISTEALVGKMRITIEANSDLSYTAFKLTDPLRLVLDLPNVDTSTLSEKTFTKRDPLMRITPFQFQEEDTVNSRIEIALSHLVPYQVFSDANKLFVDLEIPTEETAMTAPAAQPSLPPGFEELPTAPTETVPVAIEPQTQEVLAEAPAKQPEPQPEATADLPSIHIQRPPAQVGGVTPLPGQIPQFSTIKDFSIDEVSGKTRLVVRADKVPEFDIKRTKAPHRLTIDLQQSELPPGKEIVLTPDNVETMVKQVRVFQLRSTPDKTDSVVRILVDLLKPVKHEVKIEPGMMFVDIEHPLVLAEMEDEMAEQAQAEEADEVDVPLTAGIEDILKGEELEEAEAEFSAEPTIRAPKTAEEKEYKGQLISIHFQEANILDVLQVIAEVSGLNLVVHPDVSGTVTVHLVNVPWDQALDIVLKMNELSVEIEGNILRVASADVFQQEVAQKVEQQRQQIEARRVQEELEPLETKLITLNFARPGEIVNVIEGYFQGTLGDNARSGRRGTITVDSRTKTLIIQDTEVNIEKIEEIVATLDRRTPQVMIEARVVSLSSSYRKELGINWWGNFNVDAQHGNSLDYRFPYSINSMSSFGVNLPEVNPVGTTGTMRLGSIDDVVTLFARIDAAESSGKAKVLSQPKIFTQDNVAASVTTGTSFFVILSGSDEEGATLQEITASLSLSVLPRISSDGHITMTVNVSNDSPNFAQAATNSGVPPINSQAVRSEVTLKDGETTVIGGIFQTTERENFNAVPFLHKIPLIGHLFKSTMPNSQQQDELLVFLTPYILERNVVHSEQGLTDASASY